MESNTPEYQIADPFRTIQIGAESIMKLFEEEKAELAKGYEKRVQELETQLLESKWKATGYASQVEAIKNDLTMANEDARLIERYKSSHKNLKSALEDLGMTYDEDSITVTFKEEAARVVAEVYNDAKSHGDEILEDLQSPDQVHLQPSFLRLSTFIDLVGKMMERNLGTIQRLEAQCKYLQEQQAQPGIQNPSPH